MTATITNNSVKKDFQRIFEFVVKHKGAAITGKATNAQIKRLLRWAWFHKMLIILFHDRRIAAVAVCWRTDHPENNYQDMTFANTEFGDYISVYCVIVHPDYRGRGMMLPLLGLAMKRFDGANKIFWTIHARGSTRIKITTTEKLSRELMKWLRAPISQK